MEVNKRRSSVVEECGALPMDVLEVILTKADVETKVACALASSALWHHLLTSRCWSQEVVEKLSVCLEYSLVGRFNCLLRRQAAPHLTSLSIHMAPDHMEDFWATKSMFWGRLGRGLFFELRGLRLVDLRVYHRGATPVLSTHNLPTTLRKLSFPDWQNSDAQVVFHGQATMSCLYLYHYGPWYFAPLLPASVTHLTLMCSGHNLLDGLHELKQCSHLKELDVYVSWRGNFEAPFGIETFLARALESLCMERVGLHILGGQFTYIPDCNVAVVHCTYFIGQASNTGPYVRLDDQVDHKSRCSITKLTLHIRRMSWCPKLSGFSALTELVIADSERFFGTASTRQLWLKTLEVVAATLRHLTLSSNSEETEVKLPENIRLRSFACVYRCHLLLHCDAHTLSQGLEEVIVGYQTIAGTGVRLVEELAPRLTEAVLEVLGPETLRQRLLFTRPGLVGEWWHRVFQVSKEHFCTGHFCSRAQVWAQGHLCPQYLNFPRYGINSAHEDRKVFDLSDLTYLDELEGEADDEDENKFHEEDSWGCSEGDDKELRMVYN